MPLNTVVDDHFSKITLTFGVTVFKFSAIFNVLNSDKNAYVLT